MGKGHRKGWKKAQCKLVHMPLKNQIPSIPPSILAKGTKLNWGNSFTFIAFLVGVYLMIINPPLALKILGLAFVCWGFFKFFRVSHWTYKWSRKRQNLWAFTTLAVLCSISIPQLRSQWRTEHSLIKKQPEPGVGSTPIPQPPKPRGLSMRIGGFITTGIEDDSTHIQVTIIASNDGDPTTAHDWNMKITTSGETILSRHAFGEPLAKRSLEIPRLDTVLQQPLARSSEVPGYVSFIVPHVAQRIIDNLYKDREAQIIVSVRDSNNREVYAERSLYELWSERHVHYPSK
jgi:hypothetical protein